MNPFIVFLLAAVLYAPAHVRAAEPAPVQTTTAPATSTVPIVPFYSQFKDISSARWQKVGCGITSLAMIIAYYEPAVPVDALLKEGIARGAYLHSAGWTYQGLIGVASKHGLVGGAYDLGSSGSAAAFEQLQAQLKDGPVIASVHYKFDPKSTIPHLVVIDAIADGLVYYNDPAAKTGEKTVASSAFLKAWKKRFIVLRPAKVNAAVAYAQ